MHQVSKWVSEKKITGWNDFLSDHCSSMEQAECMLT